LHGVRGFVITLLGLCLSAARLGAQSAITGAVTDSLSAGPVAGSTVQLVSANNPAARLRETTTDFAGIFRFDAVPADRYLIGFLNSRLDVLGIEPFWRLDVRSGDSLVRTDLALPSGAGLERAFCGARRDSSGLLLGRVLDADSGIPVVGAAVTVRWRDLKVDAHRVDVHDQSLRVTTDVDAHFSICGVPTGDAVLVEVMSDSRRTGGLEVRVPPGGALARDLFLPGVSSLDGATAPQRLSSAQPRARTARVRGHVLTLAGRAPATAHVSIWGDDRIEGSGTADSTGVFAIDGLTPGTATLEARALGFQPARVLVDLSSAHTAVADVTLGDRTTRLDTLRVFARRRPPDLSGFEERLQRNWFGRFLTAKQIEAMHVPTIAMVLTTVPGLQVLGTEFGSRVTSSRRCIPSVYLDGFELYNGDTALADMVTPDDVRGIEVYLQPGTAPLQYGHNQCGSILVWTKRYQHE